MPPTSAPVVRILAAGAALTLSSSGCGKTHTATSNPPPPEENTSPEDVEAMATGNPPPPEQATPPEAAPNPETDQAASSGETNPLPEWDAVESGHPEGATNPPMPVLAVTTDGRCFKEWRGGMLPPDPEVLATGGRVIASPSDTEGTEVQCPPKAKEVLAAAAAREADADTPE